MVMVTVGTGVGGAIVTNGKLMRGGFGIGGEIGHMNFIPNGKACGCGQKGCLEQYGSGTALLNMGKELVASGKPEGKHLAELCGTADQLTGSMVYQAILDGDQGALGILNQLGENLGTAIASIAALLDPEIVVIGGGVSVLGETLLAPIRQAYLEHLPARGFRPEIKLVAAELVNEAGAIGAADLARHGSQSR
jgi:glucokinase